MLIGAKITRVSLERQVGNYSADAQDRKFDKLGQENGVIFPDEFRVDDEGYSGADFNRPSIKKTMRWVKEGRINVVGWAHIDRFARNVEGGLATIRMFRKAGAQILLGHLGLYRDESTFRLHMLIYMMLAEHQRDVIREKSIEGVFEKVRKGFAHGGRSPYGWRFVTALELAAKEVEQARREGREPVIERKPKNVHEPVAEHHRVLHLMEDAILAGESQRGVCRFLLEQGVKSPTGKPRWNPTTVTSIVHDLLYSTAIWHYNKHMNVEVEPEDMRNPNGDRHRMKTGHRLRAESEWIEQKLAGGPVWTPQRQAELIVALERNGRTSVGKPARPASEGGVKSVLSGMLTCGRRTITGEICNHAWAPRQKSTPNGRRLRYGCTNRDDLTGAELCQKVTVERTGSGPRHAGNPTKEIRTWDGPMLEETLCQGVADALIAQLPDLVRRHQDQMNDSFDAAELDSMKAREKKLAAKLDEARRKEILADDAEAKETYSNLVAELKGELKLLQRRLATMAGEAEEIVVNYRTIAAKVKAAATARLPENRRAFLLIWVAEIVMLEHEAEVTLKVPIANSTRGANCPVQQPALDNYIHLKTKVRVAA